MAFLVAIITTLLMLQQGEGANVTVPAGHWRISLEEETILRCPYGANSCAGGTLAGDFLCSDGFFGLLCASPVQDNYIEWTAQDSLFCDDVTTIGSFAIPVLVLLSLLIFICRNVGLREGARQQRDSSAFCKIFPRPASQLPSASNALSASTAMIPASSPASVGVVNPHRPHNCTATPTSVRSARPLSSPTLSVVATSVTEDSESAITNGGEGDDHAADANFDLLHKIKILIFAMQVCPSQFHTNNMHISYQAKCITYLCASVFFATLDLLQSAQRVAHVLRSLSVLALAILQLPQRGVPAGAALDLLRLFCAVRWCWR